MVAAQGLDWSGLGVLIVHAAKETIMSMHLDGEAD